MTGFFFIETIWSGGILLYINRRFVWLVLIAAIALIVGAQLIFQERRRVCADETGENGSTHRRHASGSANLWWMVLPFAMSILIPAQPLDAAALARRGVAVAATYDFQGAAGSRALERPPEQRSVLDWIRAFHAADFGALDGAPADMIGFIDHDPRLKVGQWMLVRFVVTNCVADAGAIGIIVEWSTPADLPSTGWVRVQGVMASGELAGRPVPVLIANQVRPIQPPEQPYLFP